MCELVTSAPAIRLRVGVVSLVAGVTTKAVIDRRRGTPSGWRSYVEDVTPGLVGLLAAVALAAWLDRHDASSPDDSPPVVVLS